MLNLNPQTINVQALDGHLISTLSPMETAALDFYHSHSRKSGASMSRCLKSRRGTDWGGCDTQR